MNITSGQAVLAAEEQGRDEPPVLLLHAGVTDRRSWRHVVDALPARRCIAYDARGFGQTTFTAEEGWSPVDDAVAVLDAHEVASAVVVACSMGGRTALDLAISHPDRVQALVLIGTAVSGAPDIEVEDDLSWLEAAYEKAEQDGDLDEVNRLDALVWLDGPRTVEGRVGGPARELFLEMNRTAIAADETGDARRDVNAWERAAEVACPTLVLVGEHDLTHIHDNARHLAASIPGARLVELPGVAHLPHVEADETTLREIAAFVATI